MKEDGKKNLLFFPTARRLPDAQSEQRYPVEVSSGRTITQPI